MTETTTPKQGSPEARLPKTATITLTSAGSILSLRAHRLRVGAETFVTITADKKTTRGMTETMATWADALAGTEKQAKAAEKIGWVRKIAGRGFVAAPDAFSELPKAKPKAVKKAS